MRYALFILRRAQKELGQIAESQQSAIIRAIQKMTDEPRPSGCIKLTGRDGWRMRVGNFRVIYEIDDNTREVVILHIGHRRDIYR